MTDLAEVVAAQLELGVTMYLGGPAHPTHPLTLLKGPCHLRLSFSMLKSYVNWSLWHASFPLKQNK